MADRIKGFYKYSLFNFKENKMDIKFDKLRVGEFCNKLSKEDKKLITKDVLSIGRIMHFSDDNEWVAIPTEVLYEIQKEVLELLKIKAAKNGN